MTKKNNLPKKLVAGKSERQETKVPTVGGRGRIDVKLKDIHWTPTKLSIASTVLLAPLTLAIVLSFQAGNSLVAIILIGLGLFVGLMYLALRFIENNDL